MENTSFVMYENISLLFHIVAQLDSDVLVVLPGCGHHLAEAQGAELAGGHTAGKRLAGQGHHGGARPQHVHSYHKNTLSANDRWRTSGMFYLGHGESTFITIRLTWSGRNFVFASNLGKFYNEILTSVADPDPYAIIMAKQK